MQSIVETVEYFKTVSEMINGSTLAFEKKTEPFCMWSWVMKEDCPVDLTLMGFNPAFKKSVNDKAIIGVRLSELVAANVVNYWIERFWPLVSDVHEVKVSDYISSGKNIMFDLVVAYRAELLGQRGIAMVFLEKAPKCVVELPDDLVKEAEVYDINIQEVVEKYLKLLKGTYP